MFRGFLTYWRWLVPLLLFSADAHAWGLYTHVYFAQLLLWAVPLTDPRYKRIIKSFPHLVMAGACLPDLSLVGRHFGAHNLDDTHKWESPLTLLETARCDEEYAIALGYASHLLVDVIAHNHFVPAHEKMWGEIPLATHAAAEWAMDYHLRTQLFARPDRLMRQNAERLSLYVSRNFGCSSRVAERALQFLAQAEAGLRGSRIPQLCYRAACALDKGVQRRFNYYLTETALRLQHINRILAGEEPVWHAEPPTDQAMRERIGNIPYWQLRHRIPLPQDLFAGMES